MFNIPISLNDKRQVMDIFEIFTRFPHDAILIKNGDITIDAHSIMGFFSLDISKPVELMLHNQPNENLTSALSKYMVTVWY